jgi:hypothetical protein
VGNSETKIHPEGRVLADSRKGEQSGTKDQETKNNEKEPKNRENRGEKAKYLSPNVKSSWLTFYNFIPSAQARLSLRQQIDSFIALPISVS